MASTLPCCLRKTQSSLGTFQKGNQHLWITDHVPATLKQTLMFFISYNFSPPNIQTIWHTNSMGPLQKPIQISTTAITWIWFLGMGVLWNPQHLALLLKGEISLENQRKGSGSKQCGNPKRISQLCMHCLHDDTLAAPAEAKQCKH